MIQTNVVDGFIELIDEKLKEQLPFPCVVRGIPTGDDYPLITIEEISNIDTNLLPFSERRSNIGIEINIYTKRLTVDGNTYNERQVANAIRSVIGTAIAEAGLRRVSDVPTPNVDTTLYRQTMRFNGGFDIYRNHFIY